MAMEVAYDVVWVVLPSELVTVWFLAKTPVALLTGNASTGLRVLPSPWPRRISPLTAPVAVL